MRRLIVVLAAAACAQPGMPPGGPPDKAPPVLVRVQPDSNARNVRSDAVVFEFNEVVSERPQGAQSLADAFVISPSKGPPSVSWRRRAVVVAPPGGLRPNTTYTVRLLPGMTDLERNVDSAGRVVVFSTGPEIATSYIRGTVFDWMAARPATAALVEAIQLPDSAAFRTTSDSMGAFRLSNMTPGRYLLRALVDQDRNRRLDPRELFDSVTITLADSVQREMLAILRDSLGPGLLTVDVRDSTTLRVSLDRALDTSFTVTPASFTLKSADSSAYVIRSVLTEREVERLAADSAQVQRVQDSVRQAARADSIRLADSIRTGVAPTGRRPGVPSGPPPVAGRGAARPQPRPAAKLPSASLVLVTERPLPPRTSFRLRAIDLRGITGAVRSSDRVFTTPEARPRTRPDTGAGPR